MPAPQCLPRMLVSRLPCPCCSRSFPSRPLTTQRAAQASGFSAQAPSPFRTKWGELSCRTSACGKVFLSGVFKGNPQLLL